MSAETLLYVKEDNKNLICFCINFLILTSPIPPGIVLDLEVRNDKYLLSDAHGHMTK